MLTLCLSEVDLSTRYYCKPPLKQLRYIIYFLPKLFIKPIFIYYKRKTTMASSTRSATKAKGRVLAASVSSTGATSEMREVDLDTDMIDARATVIATVETYLKTYALLSDQVEVLVNDEAQPMFPFSEQVADLEGRLEEVTTGTNLTQQQLDEVTRQANAFKANIDEALHLSELTHRTVLSELRQANIEISRLRQEATETAAHHQQRLESLEAQTRAGQRALN